MAFVHKSGRPLRCGLLVAVGLSLAGLWVHYGAVLKAPGDHLFSDHGDGLKNYFGFAWHARYDTTASVFAGMNHPYGEHIGYPDAQPIFTNTWRVLLDVMPEWHVDSVAVVNLLMLLSIPLCAVFLYLILLEFRVAWWYAACCAVPIAFISPQIERMFMGHYALAYGWWIPAAWWLYLRSGRSAKPWLWSMALGLLVLCGLWTHVYLGFICAAFVLLAVPLDHFAGRSESLNRLWPAACVTGALLLFGAMLRLTDMHVGRTDHPTGFFNYCATWAGFLTAGDEWNDAPFKLLFGTGYSAQPEGRIYPGLGALLWAIIVVLLLAVSLFRRRATASLRLLLPVNSRAPLLSAFLLLLFAFGLPFVLAPFEDLLWHTPVIRQFRAPSRFAWVIVPMLAVMSAHAAWVLWSWQRRSVLKWLSAVPLVTIPVLCAIEGFGYNVHAGARVLGQPNIFVLDNLDPTERSLVEIIQRQNVGSLLVLPYCNEGAEEVLVHCDPGAIRLGQLLAYHTGVPLINSTITRTSIQEARKQVQAVGPSWYERPRLPFALDETILVLVKGELHNAYDRAIIGRAKSVHSIGDVSLHLLAQKDLLKDDRAAAIADWQKAALVCADSTSTERWCPDEPVLFDNYDGAPATHSLLGAGALSLALSERPVLATFDGRLLDPGVHYEVSFWFYNHGPMQSLANVCVMNTYSNGEVHWDHCTDPRFSRTINGDWTLVELPFDMENEDDLLTLYIEADHKHLDSAWIDELLVRRSDVDLYRTLPGQDKRSAVVQRNGHLILLQ
ncbi:MAG: hypothetical protein IPI55_07825 [Flavobacteriales bacterium]|nr:hypothetical protein [Flavobacteriales bacterium]